MRDVNGNVLNGGDFVAVIKDLKVKGSSVPLKQGTVIRNIRLVDGDAEHIEGNSEKVKGLVLKTRFLKKGLRSERRSVQRCFSIHPTQRR